MARAARRELGHELMGNKRGSRDGGAVKTGRKGRLVRRAAG